MKQIKDHSLFLQEFQKLINSKLFDHMRIDEDANGVVIRLQEHIGGGQKQKRQQLMDSLAETVGILATYPESVRNQFLSIAEREGEEDREGTQL